MTTPTMDAHTEAKLNLTMAVAIGAVVQGALALLPVLDLWVIGSIERHVRTAYPDWGSAEVNADTTAIVIGMVIVGIVGVAGWLVALMAARRRGSARRTVTILFVVGMTVLAVVAGLGGAEYDQIVPLWMGATTLAVSAVTGATAVLAAWWRTPR